MRLLRGGGRQPWKVQTSIWDRGALLILFHLSHNLRWHSPPCLLLATSVGCFPLRYLLSNYHYGHEPWPSKMDLPFPTMTATVGFLAENLLSKWMTFPKLLVTRICGPATRKYNQYIHFTLMSQCLMFHELVLKKEGLDFPQTESGFHHLLTMTPYWLSWGAWFFCLIPKQTLGEKWRIWDQTNG